VEALYEEGAKPFPFASIKAFLDEHPSVFQKNAHIIRNEGLLISLKKEGSTKEFCGEGNEEE